MKTVMIIDSESYRNDTFKTLLEFYGLIVFQPRNEKEVLELLKNKNVGYIIFEPVLAYNFLEDPESAFEERGVHDMFKAGKILFEKIKVIFSGKIIFLTTQHSSDISEFVYKKECSYLQKPELVEVVVKEIKN